MHYISQVTHYLDVAEARELAIDLLRAANEAEARTAKAKAADVTDGGDFHVRMHNFGQNIGAWATRTEVHQDAGFM